MAHDLRRAAAALAIGVFLSLSLVGCVTVNNPPASSGRDPSETAEVARVDDLNQAQIDDYAAAGTARAEDMVLRDATDRFETGLAPAPLHVSCQTSSNTVEYNSDLKGTGSLTYLCTAVTEVGSNGIEYGERYTVQIEAASGIATFHRG